MSSFDRLFENKDSRHFRTRAVGQLWLGPLADKGYDNRVLRLTYNEMEFKNSVEANKYMNSVRRKYASPRELIGGNRMRYISRGDEY